jgi:hypothetical protein
MRWGDGSATEVANRANNGGGALFTGGGEAGGAGAESCLFLRRKPAIAKGGIYRQSRPVSIGT